VNPGKLPGSIRNKCKDSFTIGAAGLSNRR
jgi:hypothetical protein